MDHGDTAARVAREFALELERSTYARELDAMVARASGADEPDTSEWRRRTDLALREANVSEEEVSSAKRAFLDKWVRSLETDYISHEQRLMLKETVGMDGEDDGVTKEQHTTAMEQIEVAHAVALAELEKLGE